MRRKICVVTGTRAEYGLLYWLMKAIEQDDALELQLVVTGMHLSPEFGLTYQLIEQDGFVIRERVEMLLSSDTPAGITKSVGLGTIGFADAFQRLRPDIIVLLGDRFEILAAAQAALFARIPVAHIHGGEVTEGAVDEAIRHMITKMACVHFVAAAEYRRRVVQMGEAPARVFNVGALGIDNIHRLTLLSREELQQSLHFTLRPTSFLVTYHPVTLDACGPEQAITALLQALDCFPEASVVFTMPNADTDGRRIMRRIQDYVGKNPHRAVSFASLGQLRYLSAMRQADVIIGNSSSGIIEAPAMGKPTVNIGRRQAGRLRAPSVIDCPETAEDIAAAIRQALSEDFRQSLDHMIPPYGGGNAAGKIVPVLKSIDLRQIVMKRFFDIKHDY